MELEYNSLVSMWQNVIGIISVGLIIPTLYVIYKMSMNEMDLQQTIPYFTFTGAGFIITVIVTYIIAIYPH